MNANSGVAVSAARGAAAGPTAGVKRPWAIYTIVEAEEKSFWRRIGSAFANRDGSFNLFLDALPVNGRLHMREAESALNSERP